MSFPQCAAVKLENKWSRAPFEVTGARCKISGEGGKPSNDRKFPLRRFVNQVLCWTRMWERKETARASAWDTAVERQTLRQRSVELVIISSTRAFISLLWIKKKNKNKKRADERCQSETTLRVELQNKIVPTSREVNSGVSVETSLERCIRESFFQISEAILPPPPTPNHHYWNSCVLHIHFRNY